MKGGISYKFMLERAIEKVKAHVSPELNSEERVAIAKDAMGSVIEAARKNINGNTVAPTGVALVVITASLSEAVSIFKGASSENVRALLQDCTLFVTSDPFTEWRKEYPDHGATRCYEENNIAEHPTVRYILHVSIVYDAKNGHIEAFVPVEYARAWDFTDMAQVKAYVKQHYPDRVAKIEAETSPAVLEKYYETLQHSLLSKGMNSLFCWGCNKPETDADSKFQRCSRCKIAYYCNAECQRADWARHKKEECTKK